MELSPTALVLIGVLLAGWTGVAAWLVLRAELRQRGADAARKSARRMARMMNQAPALALLVRPDGRIEGSDRLAAWLGLESMPEFLGELGDGQTGLEREQLAELTALVQRSQRAAAPFSLSVTPLGAARSLAVRGGPADPQVAPGGAALLWWFDFSESEGELARLRDEARRAREDFTALVGLIEAAPMPMWFRGPDTRIRLVNSAYVRAVGAAHADKVVAGQIELIEPVDGLSAPQIAAQARAQGLPVERMVTATIDGQRRALRVSDLPLGADGVAGYAVDVEEMEEQARTFRAFREAQRSMLDRLSIGVAQFDAGQRLSFANQPFQRIFALPGTTMIDPPDFPRFLDLARDAERLPEMRDFPAWRRELAGWFAAGEPKEEFWALRDGTHLRILAQPMPDGGIVMVAEDRTEQLALSATRDTLLRTRTATFDSLFEALAVFAPDGKLQLWNRRFANEWGLEDSFLDDHPRIDALLDRIGEKLARPGQRKAIGDVVRAATLDRQQKGGQVRLSDGRTMEFAGVPLPDGNGLLTVLDVTDSRKAEDALRERAVALEEADAVKTRFLANMSYEFRTPLTSISGFAELLQSGMAGELTPQARDYVDAILTSVERLSNQIEAVLDLTQSEAGLLPLASEEIALLPFATQVAREREKVLEERDLTLDLRGDRTAGNIMGDKRRLSRAVGNLLDNAINATPAGGRILMTVGRKRNHAQIVISDSGRGMSPAELARALDGLSASLAPAGEGEGEGKAEAGRGLGLRLARQLIEAHGGRLDIVSEPGAGTTATVILP